MDYSFQPYYSLQTVTFLKDSSEVFFPQPDWRCSTSGSWCHIWILYKTWKYSHLVILHSPPILLFSTWIQHLSFFSWSHFIYFCLCSPFLFCFTYVDYLFLCFSLGPSTHAPSIAWPCIYVKDREIAVNLSVFDLAWLRWKPPLLHGPHCIRSFWYCPAQLLTQLPRLTVCYSNW